MHVVVLLVCLFVFSFFYHVKEKAWMTNMHFCCVCQNVYIHMSR